MAQNQEFGQNRDGQIFNDLFQKLYSSGPYDDLCYGMGLKCPRVPLLFQTMPEGKDTSAWFRLFGITEGNEDERRKEAMIELIDAYVCDNLEVQGQKYVCKLDNNVFHNENQAVGHMYDAHHQKIEELLIALLNDMEQDQTGFFFSKLLYSDFVYAGKLPPIKEMSPEFPGVLAPDLSVNIAAQNELPQKKSKR